MHREREAERRCGVEGGRGSGREGWAKGEGAGEREEGGGESGWCVAPSFAPLPLLRRRGFPENFSRRSAEDAAGDGESMSGSRQGKVLRAAVRRKMLVKALGK